MKFLLPICVASATISFAATCVGSESIAPLSVGSDSVKRSVVETWRQPLAFTQNDGQWPDSILFRAGVGGSALWFVKSGVFHQFVRRVSSIADTMSAIPPSELASISEKAHGRFKSVMLKKSLLGANPNPQVFGENGMEYKCNYFKGNDPSKWCTDVPNFEEIRYVDIYPGIDLRFYGNGKQLEYDFIVSPGADYRQIRFEYDTPEALALTSEGDLQIELNGGEVTERQPVIYQDINGIRKEVLGGFAGAGDREYGFSISGPFDPTVPLIIDPSLVWSTYLGGSNERPFPYTPYGENGISIAIDKQGSAYVTGTTPGSDFSMLHAADSVFNDGSANPYPPDDGFVTKFNVAGNALVYSTYLGGAGYDAPADIAVDAGGNAYVVGGTGSYDYPLVNPFQSAAGGQDGFVTKLGPAGNTLVYSTRLGGACCGVNNEGCSAVAVDASGSAIVVGATPSDDFPILNAVQNTRNGPSGTSDGFITKFSPAGSTLIYSTYLGSNGDDFINDVAVESDGTATAVGWCWNTDYPTFNPLKIHAGNGNTDAVVTKLSPLGAFVFSTYLGGEGGDENAQGVAVDATGDVFVTGQTSSSDFPSKHAFDTKDGSYDAYVIMITPLGDSLIFASPFGGTGGYDQGTSIQVDNEGNVYLAGGTSATDFPTKFAFQPNYAGGVDFFLMMLCSGDHAPVYSTYFGSSGNEEGLKTALDTKGNVYGIGTGSAGNTPPLQSSYDNTLGGTTDAYVFKLNGLSGGNGCCIGLAGNVDCDACNRIDISDLTRLIDYLYISYSPLCCTPAANTDGEGGIDIADLTALIDYLYVSFTPTAVCQ